MVAILAEVVISPLLDALEWVRGAASAGAEAAAIGTAETGAVVIGMGETGVVAIGMAVIGTVVTGMDATGTAIGIIITMTMT